jgi:hypothetical protein
MSTGKKKKKKKKSSEMPAWLLPLLGGCGILLVVLAVVLVFRKSIGDRFASITAESAKAIPADAEKVLMIWPKSLSGSSGFTAGDILQGGGGHLAPRPPKGFNVEKGQVEEAWRVSHGGKRFDMLRFVWKVRPERGATVAASHRGYTVYDCKGRFAVPNGNDLLLFDSKDDAVAAVNRMLDSKSAPAFLPKEKTSAVYHSTLAGAMKHVLNEDRGPDLPTPKFTHAEMLFIDSDYHVNYTFTFPSAEDAAKANDALKASRVAIEAEKKKFWEENASNIEPGRNPYSEWERRSGIPVQVEGASIKYKLPFWKMTQAGGQPLTAECFGLGDGADDEEDDGGKKLKLPLPGRG